MSERDDILAAFSTLWQRALALGELRQLLRLDGDAGAKRLVAMHQSNVREVALGTDAIFLDIDAPEALAKLRQGHS